MTKSISVRLGLAAILLGLGVAGVSACDSEDPECTKDADCQEITCSDGTKLQSCEEGACLAGDDCEVETSGGW